MLMNRYFNDKSNYDKYPGGKCARVWKENAG